MASGWQVQSISLVSFSFVVRNDKLHNSAQKLKKKKHLTPLHHFDSSWICITNIRNEKSFTIWSEIKKEKIPPPHHFESFWICITEIRTDSCLKIVNNNSKENCYQSWDIVEKQVETSSFNNHENVKKKKKNRNEYVLEMEEGRKNTSVEWFPIYAFSLSVSILDFLILWLHPSFKIQMYQVCPS